MSIKICKDILLKIFDDDETFMASDNREKWYKDLPDNWMLLAGEDEDATFYITITKVKF